MVRALALMPPLSIHRPVVSVLSRVQVVGSVSWDVACRILSRGQRLVVRSPICAGVLFEARMSSLDILLPERAVSWTSRAVKLRVAGALR
jgi:hypothetical protein